MTADLQPSVASSRVVIEAQRLFDGQQFVEPARVAVADGAVVAVGPTSPRWQRWTWGT